MNKNMGKKENRLIWILVVVLFFLSLRIIHPSADPPETLSTSAGPYGDPGGYAFNARNKVLFGQWEIDDVNSALYASPIPSLTTYLFFRIFGVGIVQMNSVPILFSWLTLILLFFIFKETLGHSPSLILIGFSLVGSNYLFLMYSRIANRVMDMIFFLVLALFFFLKGTRKTHWFLLAGMASFLAFAAKGVCFYIIGAFFFGFFLFLLFEYGLKKAFFPFGLFMAGFFCCLFFWIIFIYIPHGNEIRAISALNVSFLIPPKSLSRMLYYFWIRPPLLLKSAPFLTLLSGLSFLLFVFKALNKPRKIQLTGWIMLLWYMSGTVYFSIIQQRVTRHFIPQIIPMVFLSVWLIRDFLKKSSFSKPDKIGFFPWLALFLWLLFPLSKIVKPLLDILPPIYSNIWLATAVLITFSFSVTLLVLLLIRVWPDHRKIVLSSTARRTAVALILLGVFVVNGKQVLSWALYPQYKIKHISQDLGSALDRASIAGLWAPVICMENSHRAHEYFPGAFNDTKDFLEKYGITHILATTFFGEINDYRRNFPEAMNNARLLVRYHIWKGDVLLFELNPSPQPISRETLYEAENYTLQFGMPRYDGGSSGGFAVLSQTRKPGPVAVVLVPERFPAGRYKVNFRMKRNTGVFENTTRIARIDVVSPQRQRLLEAKDLRAEDFPSDGSYREFSLTFDLTWPSELNFRIYSDASFPFWVDCVAIEKISGD